MSEILSKLFSSETRVKILRLLFRNPQTSFKVTDLSERIQVDYYAARRDLLKLKKIRVVKVNEDQEFLINPKFEFYEELKALILSSAPINKQAILKELKKIGGLKLVVLTGVFLGQEDSRVDLLIVGSGFKEDKLDKFVRSLEADVGRELNFVVMEPDEFNYRKRMFDKFVLGVLEGPKEVLLNKMIFG